MKKLLLAICLITVSHFPSYAQYVNLFDGNLIKELKSLYPSCFNASDQMDTTCAGIVNAKSLFLSGKRIYFINGIEYFDKLDSLDISSNIISDIPKLPPALTYLKTSSNIFSFPLPKLPSTLKVLICRWNEFTTLPTLPSSLIELDCESNPGIAIPLLPSSLKRLNCANSNIKTLPSLPNGLGYLDCSNNTLTSLPNLPSSLIDLYTQNNNLTTLPSLPASLTRFNCSRNQITSLPALPEFLISLICTSNRLTSLPNLPSVRFNELLASDNCFTIFPTNPGIMFFTVSPNRSDCVTGIDSYTSSNSGNAIFPNPVLDKINITQITNGTSCKIVNSIGNTLREMVVSDNSVDVSYLESGLYFIQVSTSDGILSHKFIKE